MCGHVGIFGSDLGYVHGKVFKDMLFFDAIRGTDGTGITVVGANNNAVVHKAAMPSWDFVTTKQVKDVITNSAAAKALLGHNRAATIGSLNDKNSHPFTHGSITMAHNGTLRSRASLSGSSERFEVDSEQIAYTLSKKSDPIRAIEGIDGAYALVWHNNKDNTVHIARNSERPMWIVKEKGKDVYYYASELGIILAATTRDNRNIVLEEPENLEVYTHRVYHLPHTFKDIVVQLPDEKYVSTYVAPKGVSSTSRRSRYVGHCSDQDYFLDLEDDDVCFDTLDNKTDKKSTKKGSNIQWITSRLDIPASSGLKAGDVVDLLGAEWTPYKDGDSFGVLTGFIHETGSDFIAHSISEEVGTWMLSMQDLGYDIRGVVRQGAGVAIVGGSKIGEEDYPAIVVSHISVSCSGNKIRPKDHPFKGGPVNKSTGTVKIGDGILKSYISAERYKVLAKEGCPHCGSDLTDAATEDLVYEGGELSCLTCVINF